MKNALVYAAARGRAPGDRFQRPDLTLDYGDHPLHALDFYRAAAGNRDRVTGLAGARPLVVFIHGGAWQFGDKARRLTDRKAQFCSREGWHFAALNFRMVPEVTVAQMVADIAQALELLIARAAELGIDPGRIALIGHSSGAHLAALVGTDPRYLGSGARSPDTLAGIVAIDGAAYDPHSRATGVPWLDQRLMDPAFPPADRATRVTLSPALHGASSPNARGFLILHTERSQAASQSRLLAAALKQAGTAVERHAFPGRGARAHIALSRKLGRPGHAPSETVRRWLHERFA